MLKPAPVGYHDVIGGSDRVFDIVLPLAFRKGFYHRRQTPFKFLKSLPSAIVPATLTSSLTLIIRWHFE